MAWLGTWAKRRKVTVSNTNIDSNLTHFPLLLTLGTSVGTGNTDVSSIFDELTADANRFKIALTKTDGTTQLYGEIEKWNDASETAIIWVSKSDLVLASGATTDVYLYYDSAQANNTTYIGDTNSVVAESVWDANFLNIQHLADGVDTSHTYDSTSNDKDLTKVAANEPIETTSGAIANAQSFDGGNDVASTTNILGTTNDWTVSALVKFDNIGATANDSWFSECPIEATGDARVGWAIWQYNTNVYISTANGTVASQAGTASGRIATTTAFYNIVITKAEINASTSTINIWINNNNDLADTTLNLADNAEPFRIGVGNRLQGGFWNYGNMYMDGIVDEARVSNIVRSDAWIKADYYAQTDALVAWGAEETPSVDTGNFFLLF